MNINKIALGKAIKSILLEREYNPIHNCHLAACLAQKILAINRVDSKIVGGIASWRVNSIKQDAVYAKRYFGGGQKYRLKPFDFYGGFWLEIGDCIIDYSTFWLPIKMGIIDTIEKRKTLVLWRPDFIWMPKNEMLSLYDICFWIKVGGYYQENVKWDDKFVRRLEFSRKLFLTGNAEHDYHLPLVSDLLEDTLTRYREFNDIKTIPSLQSNR